MQGVRMSVLVYSGFSLQTKMADEKTRRKDKKNRKRKPSERDEIERLKHKETFYEQPPPGIIKEEYEKPEDCIPDLPENQDARKFLAEAPTKGLWMPLGKEVKVMKCWRCKNYGHRTGDRECPMFISGNLSSEKFRIAHEDPMYEVIQSNRKAEKQSRIAQLKSLLEESTTSESDSNTEDSNQKRNKRKHKKHKTKDEKRHKHRKHKHHKRRSQCSSDSDNTREKEYKKHKRDKNKSRD